MSFKNAFETYVQPRSTMADKLQAIVDGLPEDEREFATRILLNEGGRFSQSKVTDIFKKLGYPVTREWVGKWRSQNGL